MLDEQTDNPTVSLPTEPQTPPHPDAVSINTVAGHEDDELLLRLNISVWIDNKEYIQDIIGPRDKEQLSTVLSQYHAEYKKGLITGSQSPSKSPSLKDFYDMEVTL